MDPILTFILVFALLCVSVFMLIFLRTPKDRLLLQRAKERASKRVEQRRKENEYEHRQFLTPISSRQPTDDFWHG